MDEEENINMFLLSLIREASIYVCAAILMGACLFPLIPKDKKPDIVVPKGIKLVAIAGILLFSFIPILRLVVYLKAEYGTVQSFVMVLLSFQVGQSWLYTFFLSVLLCIAIVLLDGKKRKGYPWIGVSIVFLIIGGFGWSSHAGSIDPLMGVIIHSSHYAAVVIWIGLLFIVSFFSENKKNWLHFLKWFHVTAILCFTVTILTGLVLMQIVLSGNGYTDSWMVSYGQSLLIKHLLVIPLIGYGFFNGMVMKRLLKQRPSFDPRRWTKLESLVILFIFAATGALSHQSPPNEIEPGEISPLFTFFQGNGVQSSSMNVDWSFTVPGTLMCVMALFFLLLNIRALIKKLPPLFSMAMVICFVLCGYIGLLLSVRVS